MARSTGINDPYQDPAFYSGGYGQSKAAGVLGDRGGNSGRLDPTRQGINPLGYNNGYAGAPEGAFGPDYINTPQFREQLGQSGLVAAILAASVLSAGTAGGVLGGLGALGGGMYSLSQQTPQGLKDQAARDASDPLGGVGGYNVDPGMLSHEQDPMSMQPMTPGGLGGGGLSGYMDSPYADFWGGGRGGMSGAGGQGGGGFGDLSSLFGGGSDNFLLYK